MAKRFDLFRPLKKTDRARCAYLGLDGSAIVVFERNTPLGRQEYVKATTKVANLTLRQEQTGKGQPVVNRIVIHEHALGLLSVPLATGKPVRIEVWPNNSSENTRKQGFVNQTLAVEVAGLGRFSLNEIPGLIGAGFTLQGPGFESSLGIPEPQTAESLREANAKGGYWGYDHCAIVEFDDPLVLKLEGLCDVSTLGGAR